MDTEQRIREMERDVAKLTVNLEVVKGISDRQTTILETIDHTLRGGPDGAKKGLYGMVQTMSGDTAMIYKRVEDHSVKISELEKDGFKAKTWATVLGGAFGAGGLTIWNRLSKLFSDSVN